jgi:hypothetical protein
MEDALLFLNRLSLAFDNNPSSYRTDFEKIIYALQYLRSNTEKKAMREWESDARKDKT